MKIAKIFATIIVAASVAVTGHLGFANIANLGSAKTVDAGGAEDTAADEAGKDAKVQEFEDSHSYGKIQDEAIAGYLDKLEIAYIEKDGQILVEADRSFNTIKPSEDTARAHSSVEIGLSKTNISDAVEFVFEAITAEDVKNILDAEANRGYNAKVEMTDEHLEELVKEDRRNMVTNVVKGIGHVEQIKDLHYGESKTVYELSTAVSYLLDETETAFATKDADGEYIGMNRWLQKVDGKWYLTKDYLVNILPVVAQITEGAEISVRVVYAEQNWGLDRKDQIQLRRCVLATEPDDKAAIVYYHYFKDGTLMERPATNLRDQRPEIPSTPPKVERTAKAKETTSSPSSNDNSEKPKSPKSKTKKVSDDSEEETEAKVTMPKSGEKTGGDKTVTKKLKDETERPESREKDDKGAGEFEEIPKVAKSTSDKVEESQYQPKADQQTSGTATSKEQLTPAGTVDNGNGTSTTTVHRISEGGQEVTDQIITDNATGQQLEFIENAEAETAVIGNGDGYTTKTADDAQNGTASTNTGTVQRR